MPADYRDELQAIYKYVFDTQNAPESFRSFHWIISTSDHWRFADSSAVLGGPFDLSEKISKGAPSSFVLDVFKKMLSMPHIYAADVPPPFESLDAREIGDLFSGPEQAKLLTVMASGMRLSDQSGWALKLIFVGAQHPERFLQSNDKLLAYAKPLTGKIFYSKKPNHQ